MCRSFYKDFRQRQLPVTLGLKKKSEPKPPLGITTNHTFTIQQAAGYVE